MMPRKSFAGLFALVVGIAALVPAGGAFAADPGALPTTLGGQFKRHVPEYLVGGVMLAIFARNEASSYST